MKMELIQPFINAADAVLSQGLQSPIVIGNLSMEDETYRRKGVAAMVWLTGDIEGRVIFDLDPRPQSAWPASLLAPKCPNPTPWCGKPFANLPIR